MDERQSLIDEENEERAETGAPPIPGGSAETRSHGGAVAAAIAGAVAAALLVALVVFAVLDLAEERSTPTWVGSGLGDAIEEPSRGTRAPDLRTSSEEDAAGRYYAFWKYADDEVWGYVFDLYADGTGEFHLFLAEDEDFTRTEVDAEEHSEGLLWEQDGSLVTLTNPRGEQTLPDAPNEYMLSGPVDRRVLSPSDPSSYHYPDEVLYESYDEALANMSE